MLIDSANIRHLIAAVERDGPIQNIQFPAVTLKVDKSSQYSRIIANNSIPSLIMLYSKQLSKFDAS